MKKLIIISLLLPFVLGCNRYYHHHGRYGHYGYGSLPVAIAAGVAGLVIGAAITSKDKDLSVREVKINVVPVTYLLGDQVDCRMNNFEELVYDTKVCTWHCGYEAPDKVGYYKLTFKFTNQWNLIGKDFAENKFCRE